MVGSVMLMTFAVPGAHASFDSAMMAGSTPFGSPEFVPRHSAVVPPWAATHPAGAAGAEAATAEVVDTPVAEDAGGVAVATGAAGETVPLENGVAAQCPDAAVLFNWEMS